MQLRTIGLETGATDHFAAERFRDGGDFRGDRFEHAQVDRLARVRQCFGGTRVSFDHETVGTGSDRGQRHRLNQFRTAGSVRRIDDYRERAVFLQIRYRVQIESVASRRLKGADSAFAEDDPVVSTPDDIVGGLDPLVDGRGERALEQDWLAQGTELFQQLVVVH